MLNSKIGLTAFAIAWLCFLAAGFWFLFGHSTNTHGIRGKGVYEQRSDFSPGSLGAQRLSELITISQDYAKAHPDAAAGIGAGKELAPQDYINEVLAERHLKWRVANVHGLEVKYRSVS